MGLEVIRSTLLSRMRMVVKVGLGWQPAIALDSVLPLPVVCRWAGQVGAELRALSPGGCQPWRFFRWRFMCVVRLRIFWQTGHWVVPLCMFICLYMESRFQNDLPHSLQECDGCSTTTVRKSKSNKRVMLDFSKVSFF